MAYVDIYNAAHDTVIFQPKCIVAMQILASSIVSEPTNTPNHTARLDWANNVLRATIQITPVVLSALVLQDSAIAANPGASTDLMVQNQVNSLINTLLAIG